MPHVSKSLQNLLIYSASLVFSFIPTLRFTSSFLTLFPQIALRGLLRHSITSSLFDSCTSYLNSLVIILPWTPYSSLNPALYNQTYTSDIMHLHCSTGLQALTYSYFHINFRTLISIEVIVSSRSLRPHHSSHFPPTVQNQNLPLFQICCKLFSVDSATSAILPA